MEVYDAIKSAMLKQKETNSFYAVERIDEDWRVCVWRFDLDYKVELVRGNFAVKVIDFDYDDVGPYVEMWDYLIEDIAGQFKESMANNNS